jgi:hypothetical protein
MIDIKKLNIEEKVELFKELGTKILLAKVLMGTRS